MSAGPSAPLRYETGALGRFGRYSIHLHGGQPWIYELLPNYRTGEPGAVSKPIGLASQLPPCYLELRDVRRCVEEARDCLRDRTALTLTGGGMTTALLWLLWPLFALGNAIVRLDDWLQGTTRAAADPDKETPPPGWQPSTLRERPQRPSFELKPGHACAWCGQAIHDGETIAVDPRSGVVLHPECIAARRRTIIAMDVGG